VSILVEIAEKADVPVEGVIRVLTREPVSNAVMERVLGVLDDLTPEQTRAVQRFALAALHDVLPRPLGAEPEDVNPGQLVLPAAPEGAREPLPAPSPSDAALVQLSGVLSELAEAVRDLRRETDEERRERVDDLAVLIDLITTGWQGLDARLGRIEKQISRLDAGRRRAVAPLPALATPVPPAPAAEMPSEGAPPSAEPPAIEAEEQDRRSRLPLVAALTLAGAVIGTFAVLQLDSGGADVADLVSARDEPAQTSQDNSSTTGSGPGASSTGSATTPEASTRTRPPAARQPAPTTSSVLGTTVGKTQPNAKPKPPASAPTTKTTTAARPRSAPSKTPPSTSPPGTSSFKPTRNWAWAPVPDADYYSVEFTRGGRSFYRATPTEPRLTLPGTLEFTPGTYRWIVRAGFGTRAARRLGDPIVNSGFTVS
jgi:hypothetical protein